MKAVLALAALLVLSAATAVAVDNSLESPKLSTGIVVEGTSLESSKLSTGIVVVGKDYQSSKLSIGIVVQSVPSGGGAVPRAPLTHW